VIFRHIHETGAKKVNLSFVMSVYTFVVMHVPTWSNLLPAGHIFVKFCVWLKLYKHNDHFTLGSLCICDGISWSYCLIEKRD